MSPKKRGGKRISRRMALLLMGGGALGTLNATGAFDSVLGPRTLDLGQADDDAALLELTSDDSEPLNTSTVSYTVSDGDVKDLVKVTNSVGEPIEFQTLELQDDQGNTLGQLSSGTTVTAGSVRIDVTSGSLAQGDTLDPGASGHIEGEIGCLTCSGRTGSTVQLHVKVVGQTVTIELTRPIDLTCVSDCVQCTSATELVKYEWSGGDGGFTVECSKDPNIRLVERTLDSESEPTAATFATDYCGVDATVKAGTNEETYSGQCGRFTVTEIDGHAISHVRFQCGSDSGGGPSLPTFDCPTLCGNISFTGSLPNGIEDDVTGGDSCSSIKNKLDSNGITLSDPSIGVNVLCDNIDDVKLAPSDVNAIASRTAYIGTIDTSDDLKLPEHAAVIGDGNMTAANIGLNKGAAIASTGTVTAHGNVDIDSATVIGTIKCTNGGFAITNNANTGTHVCGDLIAKNGVNIDIDGGSVVSGDANLREGGSFNLDNSTVGGNVIRGGSVNVSGSTVCGYVTAPSGDKIDIDDGSKVGGDAVTSGGGSVQVTKSEVHGKAETDDGGNVKVEQGSVVTKSAVTDGGGNVKVQGGSGRPSTVGGDAKTSGGGNVVVKAESEVGGSVSTDSGGNIQIKDNATVWGDAVTTDGSGSITVEGGSTVKGNIALETKRGKASGSVTVTGNSTVKGNITGVKPGNLTISSNSTVEGSYPGGGDNDEDCDTDG